MRVVVDTNILIDYLIDREPFNKAARFIMELGYLGELELWMGTSQVTDLIYVLTEGGKPALAAHAQHIMRALRTFVHLYPMSEADYDAVAGCTWADLEDAFIHQVALNTKANAIITRDKTGFSKSLVKTFTCEGLLEHLQQEYGLVYAEVALKV